MLTTVQAFACLLGRDYVYLCRVVSDGAFAALLLDVVVHPDFRVRHFLVDLLHGRTCFGNNAGCRRGPYNLHALQLRTLDKFRVASKV